MKRSSAMALAATFLAGCSLNPYEGEFMCEKNRDFGKCVSVDEAYDEATKGSHTVEYERVYIDKDGNVIKQPSERSQYKASEYRELKSLVEMPITPVVAPPRVLRTLITGYSTETSLFSPRYIHYFASEPKFVIGDEMGVTKKQKRLYPNGR